MIEHVSHEEISQELVRWLRGKRSQAALSRQLGFGSNVVYTWESGRRFPEVTSFFRLALSAKLPVADRVLGFFGDPSKERSSVNITSPRTVQRLVTLLIGQSKKRELSTRLGIDRTTLARWLKGTSEPRLPEFLRLVEATSQRLLQFVELFVDPMQLSATRSAFENLTAQRKLAYDLPWSHAVLRALELEAYQELPEHQDEFLARELGLTPKQVSEQLRELERAQQIRWSNQHWIVHQVLTVDTRENPEKNQRLKAHWAAQALERLLAGKTGDSALFSFNLFAISDEGFQRIRELHLDYYEQVRGIIEQSPKADHVVLMNLQLLPLASLPTPASAEVPKARRT